MVRATAREATSARAPLTSDIAAALAREWTHGSYADLADAAIDVVVRHLADHGVDGSDERLRDAIADALAHVAPTSCATTIDEPRAADEPAQLTLFDQVEGGALAIGGAP